MSEEEKPQEGGVSLENVILCWNTLAPRLDGMANSMNLDLDECGNLGRARQVIGAFITDCERIAQIQKKHAARSPEEQVLIEEAERVLQEKMAAKGVEIKKVVGDDDSEPAPDPDPEAEDATAAEGCPADSPETVADCESQPETAAAGVEDGATVAG